MGLSQRARAKRAQIFRREFSLNENTRILDLGSGNGSAIKCVLSGTRAKPRNIYLADIDEEAVKEGERLFGFRAVPLDESGRLPFDDDCFDIVFCSSVIEHVTIPKKEVWRCLSGKQFESLSLQKQEQFAQEIRRVGKSYFVQTPYKFFPIESHTWLPFLSLLPRRVLVYCIRFTNRFWIKRTSPDWHLLTRSQFRDLFPEARIVEEKFFGLTKSLIAIKKAGQ
ncbi:class I SAM-dependent methyltransferase [Candidatus Parcubacteria bacterium]|nr:MAG: class I SAM-dependent methyltransferase [Candidatus Parcubacteria bacterium]